MKAIVCDSFSEYDLEGTNKNSLLSNLKKYGLENQVKLFDCDFVSLLSRWKECQLPPVGVYFYDGAHDQNSQFQTISLCEPFLSDKALVVDDWRFAPDSQSYAKVGTVRAIAQSKNQWTLLEELPARFNGDLEQWWNGLGI